MKAERIENYRTVVEDVMTEVIRAKSLGINSAVGTKLNKFCKVRPYSYI